ncbi:hypothetical protein PsorP6_002943 [Peronosclerospora sorghi]|uniref:Uncharacterized protein n=1 Tax=Peronosclerospora sorghi TaxID=230839 RepID=A0ACC0VN83_9STRA|nr:hypothetical protein PsorP6_002943 [Peronosclerospora sorghi]
MVAVAIRTASTLSQVGGLMMSYAHLAPGSFYTHTICRGRRGWDWHPSLHQGWGHMLQCDVGRRRKNPTMDVKKAMGAAGSRTHGQDHAPCSCAKLYMAKKMHWVRYPL